MKQECIVLLRGQLRGMGHTAECELLARRVLHSGARPLDRSVEYSDCIVLSAPAHLPDGDYMLFFAGHSTVANRVRGLWSSFGAVVRDRSADGLEEGRPVDPGVLRPARTDERKDPSPDAQLSKDANTSTLDPRT